MKTVTIQLTIARNWCKLTADYGLRTAEGGLRTADCGLQTADCGLQTVDCGERDFTCPGSSRPWTYGTCGTGFEPPFSPQPKIKINMLPKKKRVKS